MPYRDFLDMFSPIRQKEYCAGAARALRCVESTAAPTLLEAVNTYGRNKVVAWMMLQIYNLSEVAGCRDKITDAACEDAAAFLVTEYPYYRVSEIMLFFLEVQVRELRAILRGSRRSDTGRVVPQISGICQRAATGE